MDPRRGGQPVALWKIEKKPTKITVIYLNLHTNVPFDCGAQHVDTDLTLILNWVRGEADPGDVVIVDGRVVMNIMPMLHEVTLSGGPAFLN